MPCSRRACDVTAVVIRGIDGPAPVPLRWEYAIETARSRRAQARFWMGSRSVRDGVRAIRDQHARVIDGGRVGGDIYRRPSPSHPRRAVADTTPARSVSCAVNVPLNTFIISITITVSALTT
jgi:hypothetical protein